MRLRTAFGFVAACALGALAACSTKSTAPAPAPMPGGTPLAINFDYAFRTSGASFRYVFEQPGDWLYFCRRHGLDGMRGKVLVRESSGRDSMLVRVGPSGRKVFSPDTVTIKPNGTIRWLNVSSDKDHTVTSQ